MLFTQLRRTFLYTTLILCAWCALTTEILNLFDFITIKGILLAWLPPPDHPSASSPGFS